MGKRKRNKRTQKPQQVNQGTEERLAQELKILIERKRYGEALKKIKEIRRGAPEQEIPEKVEELWLKKGEEEWLNKKYEEAQKSFRKSVELGLNGEGHYWWAKSLLSLEKREEALEVMREGYEKKLLGLEYGGCYLKLLCLQGKIDRVEELIVQEGERFTTEQKQWGKGMVALLKGEEEKAAENWEKMEKKVSPSDCPWAWKIYIEQKRENWLEAEKKLEEIGKKEKRREKNQQIEQKLLVRQGIGKGESLMEKVTERSGEIENIEEIRVLEMVNLMEKKKWREAAEIAQRIGRKREEFPEMEKIYRGLMWEAGEEAWQKGMVEWTIELWWTMVEDKPLEPEFLVRLNQALREIKENKKSQRVLNKLLNWLKKEGKKEYRDWPQKRRRETLGKLHCYLADSYMGQGWRVQGSLVQGLKNLRTAEELCPELPDVLGRKGLKVGLIEGKTEESIGMLRRALEEGCDSVDVYQMLREALEEIEDREALEEIRSSFGRRFGDMGGELEVLLPVWEEALSEESYEKFERKVKEAKLKKPEMSACRIFISETIRETRGAQVKLRLESAQEKWEELLKKLPAKEQIGVIETIGVSLVRYGKRQKGRASLIDDYVKRLWEYAQEEEKARKAHLVLLIVKGSQAQKWPNYLRQYLRKTTQPNQALGQLQLKVRRYGNGTGLKEFIEVALENNPQNPLLRLALATGFPPESLEYHKLSEEGFELARRLQDKESLKAWREEEGFVMHQKLSQWFDLMSLEESLSKIEEMIDKLEREVFKRDLSAEERQKIWQEIKKIVSAKIEIGL
ncbi:tetratricopeptide repeat protein [Crocosphaera sp. Alani8]|uniref:tetratricopeptide repeat protein n=1 Tax=Crocosphaera sp. Alani8 TaxID=3038952 RepID=UPI00313B3D1E